MKCVFFLLIQSHLCAWAGEAWRNSGHIWKRALSTLKYCMIPKAMNMISWEVVPCPVERPEIHPNPGNGPLVSS